MEPQSSLWAFCDRMQESLHDLNLVDKRTTGWSISVNSYVSHKSSMDSMKITVKLGDYLFLTAKGYSVKDLSTQLYKQIEELLKNLDRSNYNWEDSNDGNQLREFQEKLKGFKCYLCAEKAV